MAFYLGERPDPRLVPALITLAEKANSYEGGAAVLSILNGLVHAMTDEQMEHLLEVCTINDQIRGSVLGNRQMNLMRWGGPQGERAKAAWDKWDEPVTDEASYVPE
ncbi:hypothetical protein LNW71_16730 [Streptomyces sp. RKAG290]|nr:hypothetical protein [Streptomyces sp. RKAG290]